LNSAQVDAGAATTYTYDPSGTPTLSGDANPFWPFLYHGMEQEFLDAPYYYTGGGQRLLRIALFGCSSGGLSIALLIH
jgi:hypothetical protein